MLNSAEGGAAALKWFLPFLHLDREVTLLEKHHADDTRTWTDGMDGRPRETVDGGLPRMTTAPLRLPILPPGGPQKGSTIT